MVYSYPYAERSHGPQAMDLQDLPSSQAIVATSVALVLLVTAAGSGMPGVFLVAAFAALAAALFSIARAIRSIASQTPTQEPVAQSTRHTEHV